jgi:hypothetical protein
MKITFAYGHIFGGPSTSLGVTGGVGGEKAAFRSFAGVAHEKFAKAAVVKHHDDAVLVDIVACVSEERHCRREDVQRYAVSRAPSHAPPCNDNRHVMRVRRRNAIPVCASTVGLPRIEDESDRHRFDDWKTRS